MYSRSLEAVSQWVGKGEREAEKEDAWEGERDTERERKRKRRREGELIEICSVCSGNTGGTFNS